MRALLARQAQAWMDGDLDAVVADFAPDGVLIAPTGRWQGRAAIRGAAVDFFARSGAVEVTLVRVVVDGDRGALEWTWSHVDRANGRRSTRANAIVFALRNGQIAHWREYFDTAILPVSGEAASLGQE